MARQGNQGGDHHGRSYYNENRSHCSGGCFVFLSTPRQEKPQAARPDPASSAAARDSIRASLLASGRLLGLLQHDPHQALAALQVPSRQVERSQQKLIEAGVTVADGGACHPIALPTAARPSHHHG